MQWLRRTSHGDHLIITFWLKYLSLQTVFKNAKFLGKMFESANLFYGRSPEEIPRVMLEMQGLRRTSR